MTKIVLLAAGKSTRTSSMKQLYKIGDEYLINVQIKKLLAYGYEVLVVLGHRYEEVLSVLDKRVEVVYNREYERGMFSSVQSVFRESKAEQFLFCHTDRPIADKEVYEKMIECKSDVAVAFCCEKKAPPIMMRSVVKEQILNAKEHRLDEWVLAFRKLEFVKVHDEKIHHNANSDRELEQYFKF